MENRPGAQVCPGCSPGDSISILGRKEGVNDRVPLTSLAYKPMAQHNSDYSIDICMAFSGLTHLFVGMGHLCMRRPGPAWRDTSTAAKTNVRHERQIIRASPRGSERGKVYTYSGELVRYQASDKKVCPGIYGRTAASFGILVAEPVATAYAAKVCPTQYTLRLKSTGRMESGGVCLWMGGWNRSNFLCRGANCRR